MHFPLLVLITNVFNQIVPYGGRSSGNKWPKVTTIGMTNVRIHWLTLRQSNISQQKSMKRTGKAVTLLDSIDLSTVLTLHLQYYQIRQVSRDISKRKCECARLPFFPKYLPASASSVLPRNKFISGSDKCSQPPRLLRCSWLREPKL